MKIGHEATYFLVHKYNETILLQRVLPERLRIIVHHLAISNQLLCFCCMSMRLHDFGLQCFDLEGYESYVM